MNRIKVYFCLLAFSFLMGIKCFQPELTESIRAKVFGIIEKDINYGQVIESLGREYTESGLKRELAEVLKIDRWTESMGINTYSAANASGGGVSAAEALNDERASGE